MTEGTTEKLLETVRRISACDGALEEEQEKSSKNIVHNAYCFDDYCMQAILPQNVQVVNSCDIIFLPHFAYFCK